MVRHSKDPQVLLADDPLWYKDALIYEIHVRAFSDSNGDGIGDFNGLVSKLDYLQDLGVTALWLLPFYPSPGRDDGYDIADYTDVNPSYGTLADFRRFLNEAHRRGLRVITELAINHTSSEHPWFQRARRAPAGSRWRNFYVWSESPELYRDARIIFPDFETSNWTWDPIAKSYYWHRFYSHQPDLNFENEEVHDAVISVLDFWMDLGVDGMRLDAIPYLYEREGTNCENLPETHQFLKKLRAHNDEKYRNRMFLAEANQWPEDAASYFGDGDECHMNFHFPLMPRMFMAVNLESSYPILDILEQTPEIPENCQWALFLRNHDELTLEMVTDEDRDYMWRVYAEDPQARINLGIRRRLAPLLKLRRKIELMHGLLFSLPGTPVLYYGDEIGMGDNIYLGDRDGVRTPMQWSYDRNAGFSRANPQKLFLPAVIDPEYHYEAINVEAQQNNAQSLLWWVKRLISLRKQHQVFGRGSMRFLRPDNPKILAFVRELDDDRVLVVANLSRFAQAGKLDLSGYEGLIPMEMFGHSPFPRINEQEPYFLALGPHEFYWFELTEEDTASQTPHAELPRLDAPQGWETLLSGQGDLERVLATYLPTCRWFRGKARRISKVRLTEAVPLEGASGAQLAFVRVDYVQEDPETYLLPLALADLEMGQKLIEDQYQATIARVAMGDESGVLYDASYSDTFARDLLALFSNKNHPRGSDGEISATGFAALQALTSEGLAALSPKRSTAEQSNTSIIFGDELILKLTRVVEFGSQPEIEIGRFLTEKVEFEHVPPLAGAMHYERGSEQAVIGVVQGFVDNQGDAWAFTLDSLSRFFERALSYQEHPTELPIGADSLMARARLDVPDVAKDTIGGYLPLARILGERTAQMHLALARGDLDSTFAPVALSTLHQRSLYQAARTTLNRGFELLESRRRKVPERWQSLVKEVLSNKDRLDEQLRSITGTKIEAARIRTHGDFHLGQVLYTGGDFVIIDFEGEPARPLGERRIKRSPLRDVAGMLRSFHYAAMLASHDPHWPADKQDAVERWSTFWHSWVTAQYLRAYLEVTGGSGLVPASDEQLAALLDFYLVDKCVYELSYELGSRPEWVWIPLMGLLDILKAKGQ